MLDKWGLIRLFFCSTWNNGTETTGTSYYFIPPGTIGMESLELVPLEPCFLLIGDTDIQIFIEEARTTTFT